MSKEQGGKKAPQEKKKSSFIQKSMEYKPFQDEGAKVLLEKWCDVADGLKTKFSPREELPEGGFETPIQLRSDGKKDLIIPTDAAMYELPILTKAVNEDFQDQKGESEVNIFSLAGVYVAKRLHGITKGRELAQNTAEELSRYGKAFTTGKYEETSVAHDFAEQELTPEQTAAVDRWLGVDTLHKLKFPTSGENDESTREQIREQILARFFTVAKEADDGKESQQKALERVQKKYIDGQTDEAFYALQGAILQDRRSGQDQGRL